MFTSVDLKLITVPSDGVLRKQVDYPIRLIIEQSNTIIHEQVIRFDQFIGIDFNFSGYDNIIIKIIPETDKIDLIDFPITVETLILDKIFDVNRIKHSGINYSVTNDVIEKNTATIYNLGVLEYNLKLPFISNVMML